MCHADASKVNDGAEDLNEILLLLNVCPDEIEEDSDEAYGSDFEDDWRITVFFPFASRAFLLKHRDLFWSVTTFLLSNGMIKYAIVKASSLWFLLCEANQYQTVLCYAMNKSSES